MKTKEEILKQYHVPITKGINVVAEIDALDAMEEYAGQFKPEWINSEDFQPDNDREVLVKFTASHGVARYAKGKWRDYHGNYVAPWFWMEIPK